MGKPALSIEEVTDPKKIELALSQTAERLLGSPTPQLRWLTKSAASHQ